MLKIIHSNNYGNYVNIQRTISRAAQYRDDPEKLQKSNSKYYAKHFCIITNFRPTLGYYNKEEVKTDIKSFEGNKTEIFF